MRAHGLPRRLRRFLQRRRIVELGPGGDYPDHGGDANRPAYQRYNAKFLARGGRTEVLEGPARGRNVIIEFASMEDALACYNSPEYTEARKIRQSVSDGEFILVEGAE